MKSRMKVLDIGCGTGGSAFYMIGIAQDYRMEMEAAVKHRTQFYIEDAMTMEYPENFYDVVYSRDTILHITDKKELFRKFLKTLKPGGKLMISDYCRGDVAQHSPAFIAYVKSRDYDLHTVSGYGKLLEDVGFTNVNPMNTTTLRRGGRTRWCGVTRGTRPGGCSRPPRTS